MKNIESRIGLQIQKKRDDKIGSICKNIKYHQYNQYVKQYINLMCQKNSLWIISF